MTAKRSRGLAAGALLAGCSCDPPHPDTARRQRDQCQYQDFCASTPSSLRSNWSMTTITITTRPDDQPIVERRAGNLRQRVAQHAEDQRAEHRAHHRAAAAGQAGAADDRRGDDIQLVAGREIGLALALDDRQDDPGHAGEQRRPARRPTSLTRPTRDPGEERGRFVAADGEHRAAPLERGHQHLEDQRQRDHDERRDPVGAAGRAGASRRAACSRRRSTAPR